MVPILHDIGAAVEEIHAAAELGLRGVLIPTRWMNEPAYHDLRYEPAFAELSGQDRVDHYNEVPSGDLSA